MAKNNRIKVGSLIFDLLIDFALIAMGAVLYYVFMIRPIGFLGINDVFVKLVGSKLVAVLIIAGIPFVVGVLSLARTIFRTARKLKSPPPPEQPRKPAA
jgi:hypothetical protein